MLSQATRQWAIPSGWADDSSPNSVRATSCKAELLEELRGTVAAHIDFLRMGKDGLAPLLHARSQG